MKAGIETDSRTIRLGRFVIAALVTILASAGSNAQGHLRLAKLLSNGMVVQRNVSIPVWGWGLGGDSINVSFAGLHASTVVDNSGSWRVALDPLTAGGPYSLTVDGRVESLRVDDVMVGDVWVASGQSNMEWLVLDSDNAEEEIASANDHSIRHFHVPRSWSWEPEDTLAGGSWEVAGPNTVSNFSAVGYFFARELRKHVDVPIGLIASSWGSSRIEAWMNASTLDMSDGVESVRAYVRTETDILQERLRERFGDLPLADSGLIDGKAFWADPDLDDSDWSEFEVPNSWESHGYLGMDGVGWYRKSFLLDSADIPEGIALGLGKIDDSDITWLNGTEIGRTDGWLVPRRYVVPSNLLREGRNVIAVRVTDVYSSGGIRGEADLLYLESAGNRQSLVGPWLFKPGAVDVAFDNMKNKVPTLLYNKMIHPLQGFPIKGVIWYQGEANTRAVDIVPYRDLFEKMINQWREEWGLGSFPFLYVQLANFGEPKEEPGRSKWAGIREAQSTGLNLPNTGQAVTIDIGEADNIHPRNKQEVGRRLSLAARKIAYGQDVVYSGPVFKSWSIDNGRVRITFDEVADGLEIGRQGSVLEGFAVAGSNRDFVWANARIVGTQVEVWNDSVQDPVAVRYAWADDPDKANLYNSAGLPASPFRTDTWSR